MISLFSRKKKNNDVLLLVDIGSGSVSVSLISVQDESVVTPQILFFVRMPIVLKKERTFAHMTLLATKALTEALDVFKNKYTEPYTVRTIVCFLSSPWHVSEIRTIYYKQDEPFVVTKKMWNDFLVTDRRAFENTIFSGHTEKNHNPVVIEQHDVSVRLNGYTTNNPFGKKARSLESSYFISISEASVLDAISEKIRSCMGNKPILFSSRVFSFYGSAQEITKSDDYILLAVEGEITDIILVRSGIFLESMSFPSGMSNVFRTMSIRMNISFSDAYTFFHMYCSGKTDTETTLRIKEILTHAEQEWMGYLQKSLSVISHSFSVPSTVFLLADDPYSKWLCAILEREDFTQYMFTEKKFDIIPFTSLLSEHVRIGGLDDRQKILTTEALFASRYINKYNIKKNV